MCNALSARQCGVKAVEISRNTIGAIFFSSFVLGFSFYIAPAIITYLFICIFSILVTISILNDNGKYLGVLDAGEEVQMRQLREGDSSGTDSPAQH